MEIGLEYIKYRRKAKHRHGIHSPFVYDFSDVCLSIPIEHNDEIILKHLISRLQNDSRSIEIDDHGVGSKKMSNTRKIRSILKNSSSKGKYGKLLYRISKHYRPENILELGTSLGIGTTQMSLGSPESIITTVEGCANTLAIARDNFKFTHINPISTHDTFEHFLKQSSTKHYDLVFVDGHHDGGALLQYMKQLEALTHDETLFIIDDIRWSESMLNAWNELRNNEKYHLSMDLFRMGILSPRTSQAKEHFTIRI